MSFQNLTPFPAISWENVDSNKQWHITTLVRVKYIFHPLATTGQWELRIAPDQDDLFGQDFFYEDNINFPIRYESDFVTYKPNTDIVINAVARNANKLSIKNPCNMVITDLEKNTLKKKAVNLFGKHPWVNGSEEKKNYKTTLGFVDREEKSRLKFAGTYDDTWIEKQHPYPPHDYDPYYNQAAQADLILKGYIPTGAKFGLSNMLSKNEDTFRLPQLHCFCEDITPKGRLNRNLMNIDTVVIDIDSDEPTDWAVYLSYRNYQVKTMDSADITVKYLPATNQLEQQHG